MECCQYIYHHHHWCSTFGQVPPPLPVPSHPFHFYVPTFLCFLWITLLLLYFQYRFFQVTYHSLIIPYIHNTPQVTSGALLEGLLDNMLPFIHVCNLRNENVTSATVLRAAGSLIGSCQTQEQVYIIISVNKRQMFGDFQQDASSHFSVRLKNRPKNVAEVTTLQ